jgi:hypothetical protein
MFYHRNIIPPKEIEGIYSMQKTEQNFIGCISWVFDLDPKLNPKMFQSIALAKLSWSTKEPFTTPLLIIGPFVLNYFVVTQYQFPQWNSAIKNGNANYCLLRTLNCLSIGEFWKSLQPTGHELFVCMSWDCSLSSDACIDNVQTLYMCKWNLDLCKNSSQISGSFSVWNGRAQMNNETVCAFWRHEVTLYTLLKCTECG